MRATDHVPSLAFPDLRPAEAAFAAELHRTCPELDAAFAAALPGARAAVLARLWRALLFEPLPLAPGVRERLRGPERRAYDIDAPTTDRQAPGFAVHLDEVAFTHPAALLEALALPGSGTLLAEVEHSVVSLALSRAGAAARIAESAWDAPGAVDPLASLEAAERSIVDGHPYHPCCRSRPGFTVADQLAYAPEHGADVALTLLRVPAAGALVVGDWPTWLRGEDGALLLPVHPWQAREVLPGLSAGLGTGLAPSGGRTLTAAPLMSVRTLAPLDGGPHLKTSLSLRMTSAVRDISGGSVRNALAVSGLLEQLTAALDGPLGGALSVTRNLAAAAVLIDGEPSADLAVVVRESPTAGLGPGERVVPLAALAAHPLKAEDPEEWLTAFARLAWPPLLALWDRGVALEAHGQNLLVVLDAADRPRRLVYRDLADIRVSPQRLARIGVIPQVSGHVLDDDPLVLRRKLLGSFVGSVLGGLVSGFARAGADTGAGTGSFGGSSTGNSGREVEDRLWRSIAAEARRAAEELLHEPADRRALLHEPLQVKALTLMRLEGRPPGDAWTEIPNPLA